MRNLNQPFLSKFSLLLLVLFCVFNSCKKDENLNVPTKIDLNSTVSSSLKNLIHSLNLDTTRIVDMGSYYVVEGDIMLQKSKLQSYIRYNIASSTLKQATVGSGLVSEYNVHHISIYADATIPTEWRDALQQAILAWNSTETKVAMTYTTNPSANILVTSDLGQLSDLNPAKADYPCDLKPGATIKINVDCPTSIASFKRTVLMHELGHTIGFAHTDWPLDPNHGGEVDIAGTPQNDAFSIMRWQIWPTMINFTNYDLIAFQTIYPNYSILGITGPTNLTGPILLSEIFTYSAYFGMYDPSLCTWELSSFHSGTTYFGPNSGLLQLVKTPSYFGSSDNEIYTLTVHCPGLNQDATISITVSNGYALSGPGNQQGN